MVLIFLSIVFVALNIWRSVLYVPLQVAYVMRDGGFSYAGGLSHGILTVGGAKYQGEAVSDYVKNGFINVPGIGYVWAGRFLKKEPTPKHIERYEKHKGKVDWLISKIKILRVGTQIVSVLFMVLAVGAFGFFIFTYGILDSSLFGNIHSFFTSVLSIGIAGAWMEPEAGPMAVFSTYALIAVFGLISFLISVINK
jgi:hypothetical protein